ncbi:MAG: VanW family protein, partial [Actinomycetia bacterium]|nr:VanW family protein [Actinomycetes bacterium]
TTVERSVHSFYISHYPTGRDATVVDGQLDFKFKNDTDGTLLIKKFILSNAVGFKIYGPDSGRENTFGDPQIYNVTAYSSKTETDTSLPPGARVVDQSGIPGRTVSVIRKVMKKGKQFFEEKIVSRYTARQEIIKVGPAPPPEEPAPSEDSTTTTETVSDTDET